MSNGAAPLAKVLAKMSAAEALHKKEIARLQTELEEWQNKCKDLQQQLDVYKIMEKNQRCKSFDEQREQV